MDIFKRWQHSNTFRLDKEYLNKIKYDIPRLINNFEPDFEFFYLSGVDIIENDKLGRLAVSIQRFCCPRKGYIWFAEPYYLN